MRFLPPMPPAPGARSFITEAISYREVHSGIPLRIRLFVGLASGTAFTIFALPIFILEAFIDSLLFSMGAGIYWFIIYTMYSIVPKWNIFIPIGFHLFKRLIEVKE